MTSVLRVLLLIFAVCFLLAIIRLVKNGRLQLKYSLLWMFLAGVLVICAVFPGLVGACANALGVGLASNFVFLVGLILLMGITLSLTVIVSWQARDIRSLVQRLALLEKRIDSGTKVDND
ncbi:MAG: DUF2304 domain-containing protein [Atopobiaceae bacterium]|jgi:hypothetical protein|nr:DUF2304 domain-containing protein [Atopobiaceae bacterium]MDD4381503.1 DUF2304 domain-containing protein [Atopobiaceae bacterium]